VPLDKQGNIQRPLMTSMYLEETAAPSKKKAKQRFRIFRLLGGFVWRLVRGVLRFLTYDPLRRKLRIEDGNAFTRFIKGLFYRLAFVPVLLAGLICLMVYQATHPRHTTMEADPGIVDVYYEAVTFMTSDNVRLEGALYPVLDAKQVLLEKEQVLRKRYPAVVLVHDLGMRKDQMLPLVRPLHESGFVVLAMNLRGNGGSGAAGQTFGLREALDVKAAVEMLRRKSFVDGARITVVGAGTGGTAALINAKTDPAVAAIVVADPIRSVETLLDGRLAPRHELFTWMRPLCKWTFEFAYQSDIDDVNWNEFDVVRLTRPVLVVGEEGGHTDFSRRKHVEEIRSFLVQQVISPKLPVASGR